jgi:hypothetical protein
VHSEDVFYLQLAKTIQAWLWVESELQQLYATLMRGANPHLVSVTFNCVQSVDSKLALLNSCLALLLVHESDERKKWKAIFGKVEKLNKKRNKVVHEPVSILYDKGTKTVSLGPSHQNALALVKGQTTHRGGPVISGTYDPKQAKLLKDHQLDLNDLYKLEESFKSASHELGEFCAEIAPLVSAAVKAARKGSA